MEACEAGPEARAAVTQLRSMSDRDSAWLIRFDFMILLALIPCCKRNYAAIAVARTVSSTCINSSSSAVLNKPSGP